MCSLFLISALFLGKLNTESVTINLGDESSESEKNCIQIDVNEYEKFLNDAKQMDCNVDGINGRFPISDEAIEGSLKFCKFIDDSLIENKLTLTLEEMKSNPTSFGYLKAYLITVITYITNGKGLELLDVQKAGKNELAGYQSHKHFVTFSTLKYILSVLFETKMDIQFGGLKFSSFETVHYRDVAAFPDISRTADGNYKYSYHYMVTPIENMINLFAGDLKASNLEQNENILQPTVFYHGSTDNPFLRKLFHSNRATYMVALSSQFKSMRWPIQYAKMDEFSGEKFETASEINHFWQNKQNETSQGILGYITRFELNEKACYTKAHPQVCIEDYTEENVVSCDKNEIKARKCEPYQSYYDHSAGQAWQCDSPQLGSSVQSTIDAYIINFEAFERCEVKPVYTFKIRPPTNDEIKHYMLTGTIF